MPAPVKLDGQKKNASPKLPRNLPQKLQVNLRNRSIQWHTHAAATAVTSVGPVGTKFKVAIAAAKNRSKWPFQVNCMVIEKNHSSNMTNAHSAERLTPCFASTLGRLADDPQPAKAIDTPAVVHQRVDQLSVKHATAAWTEAAMSASCDSLQAGSNHPITKGMIDKFNISLYFQCTSKTLRDRLKVTQKVTDSSHFSPKGRGNGLKCRLIKAFENCKSDQRVC